MLLTENFGIHLILMEYCDVVWLAFIKIEATCLWMCILCLMQILDQYKTCCSSTVPIHDTLGSSLVSFFDIIIFTVKLLVLTTKVNYCIKVTLCYAIPFQIKKKKIAMLRGGLYYMGAVNLSNISQSFSLLFVTKYWYKVPNIQNNLLLESDHKGQKFHKYQNLPKSIDHRMNHRQPKLRM